MATIRSVQYQLGIGIKLFQVNKGMESKTYLKNQISMTIFYSKLNGLSLSLNIDLTLLSEKARYIGVSTTMIIMKAW